MCLCVFNFGVFKIKYVNQLEKKLCVLCVSE
jgi:hypothetical protein